MKWHNYIIAYDSLTFRVVWRTLWKEWPRIVPTTQNVMIRTFRGFANLNDEDWNNFSLIWSNTTHSVEYCSAALSNDDLQRLKVEQMKCHVAWRFLNSLNDLERTTQPMIAGVELAESDKEEQFYCEERTAIRSLIRQVLKDYWNEIWNAKKIRDIENLSMSLNNEIRFSYFY